MRVWLTLLTLSPATLPIARAHFPFPPECRPLAIRHPRYGVPPQLVSRRQARRAWDVAAGAFHLVFAGAVRPYKGVDELAGAAASLAGVNVVLTIAGRCDEALRPVFGKLAQEHGNIAFHDQRLGGTAFESVVRAADYVALPFRNMLHSGSIVHALSLHRPVLTPATPYAEELARLVGREWICLYDPPLTPEVLTALAPPPEGEPNLEALSSARMGRSLHGFYRSLAGLPVTGSLG